MKKMFFLVIALVVMSWGQASASYLYPFYFVGAGINISGQLTLDELDNTIVTNANGFANGHAINLFTGTLDPPYSEMINFDNQLWRSENPQLSGAGLLFSIYDGSSPSGHLSDAQYINIWGIGPNSYTYGEVNAQGAYTIDGSFIATPIPAAVWLLGSGLAGLLGVRRRFTC